MAIQLKRSFSVFRKTHALETEIDTFLNQLSESGLLFKRALDNYLLEGSSETFKRMLHDVNAQESNNDGLRRSIETQLYSQTLIPDSRGDVLGLLENLDSIHNLLEGALWQFFIEKPTIPEELRAQFATLIDASVDALEALVQASRAFFRNIDAVNDHIHKVMFFEKEADKAGTALKQAIFALDLTLAEKIHLRDFCEHIDNVADRSEDVADRLSIYVIKRST